MGRVPVAEQNKTNEGGAGFPAVKLTEKGQKARFTVIEDPWREYVHYIKHPKFNDDGTVKKEKRTRKNGDEYYDYDLELLASEVCLGDEGTLREKGVDEQNCPACEASVKSGGDIPGPIQRFAVNVVYYALAGSTFNIAKPFSASIKVWKFTGRIYDEIEGIQEEIGDLRKHDITLECEEPNWQRNKLGFKMEPGYRDAPPGYLKELLNTPGNKATDAQLRDACGRDIPRARMQEDMDFALRMWRRLRNEGQVPDEFQQSRAADLSGGVEELLGEEGGLAAAVGQHEQEAAAVTGLTADPFAEFLPETTGNPSPETAQRRAAANGNGKKTAAAEDADPFAETAGSAPEETAAAQPGTGTTGSAAATASPSSGTDFDFDNLLEGL